MHEVICLHCDKAFKVGYADIVKQGCQAPGSRARHAQTLAGAPHGSS